MTGAGGFIGRGLITELSKRHQVVAISRSRQPSVTDAVVGDFQVYEDLTKLDRYEFDAAVHLAAVTGGASEWSCLSVNVAGSRTLLRYLADRSCRKMVCASSIAAIGFESVAFRPLELPITEQHPCLDRDGYGVSKYLMEEVTKYVQRSVPDLDVINLRLSSVIPDNAPRPLREAGPLGKWALGTITIMTLSDAVAAFAAAVESERVPGVRIMNAAGPLAWVRQPVAEVLRSWYGDEVDVSHFEQPGHEWDGVYDVSRIREQLGFVAQHGPDRVHGSAYPGPPVD